MQQDWLIELARERQREILAEADRRRSGRLSTPPDIAEDNLSMFEWRRGFRWINVDTATIGVR